MPVSPLVRKATRRVTRRLPRLLALVWSIWCVATAVAYVDHVPPQLRSVDGAVSAPVWAVWATAATLLFFGVVAPSTSHEKVQNVSRWMRVTGMTIACAMLILWSVAFFIDQPRGWVSGKNYALLAVMALVATWTIARDGAPRRGDTT